MLRTPVCEVLIHTERHGTLAITSHLRSVTTTKALAQPAGRFSVSLQGTEFYHQVQAMDIVEIRMGTSVKPLETIMVGLVDDVRKTKQIAGDKPTTTTTISGRDFGKILIKAMIKQLPTLDEAVLAPLSGSHTLLGLKAIFMDTAMEQGDSADFVRGVLENILFEIMDFTFNVSGKRLTLPTTLGYQLLSIRTQVPWLTTRAQFEGSLWNFLHGATSPPFHELFLDVVPHTLTPVPSAKYSRKTTPFGFDKAQIQLILRPTPFSNRDWRTLPFSEVRDMEITSIDVGRSDHEHYNMFRSTPTIDLFGQFAMDSQVPPMLNEADVRKYGISYYDAQLEGFFENDQRSDLISACRELTQTLKEWYEKNHEYENGTIQLRGTAQARIGTKLRHVEEQMEYYVESVSQNYSVVGQSATWKTTVNVTRGQRYA